MRNVTIPLMVVLVASGCSAPVGPIPGGALEGKEMPWPQDWSFTGEYDNVLLQTAPNDPYSVTIWGVSANGNFYVAAGSADNTWVQNIQANSAVVLGIEDNLYLADASLISDESELTAVESAYVAKYDIDPADNFIRDNNLVFRLTARQ